MPNQLDQSIGSIVDAAVDGLHSDQHASDSPVRSGLDVVSIPRSELASLRDEITRLGAQQAQDLLSLASRSPAREALELLHQAVESHPSGFAPRLQLGVALRKAQRLEEASRHLRVATQIDSSSAEAWRQLGVALSRDLAFEEAEAAFDRSLELEPEHSETWSNLGGLRRRMSRVGREIRDWELAGKAQACYTKAVELDPRNSYPLLNRAVLALCLSSRDGDQKVAARDDLEALEHLCRFEVGREPYDPWKRLDLTETLALLGRVTEARRAAEQAVASIDEADMEGVLASATDPLADLVHLQVLDEGQRTAVDQVLQTYSSARARAAP
jgi:tetratricopeptide (TPR) repeat protein